MAEEATEKFVRPMWEFTVPMFSNGQNLKMNDGIPHCQAYFISAHNNINNNCRTTNIYKIVYS